jgi:hypothetical protein
LEQVLEYVAQGGTDPEALTTLAGRLARLQREFTAAQVAELRDHAGGKSFPDLAHELLNACDPDAQIEAAKQKFGVTAPPPLAATPVQLWRAFEAVEADKVKGSGGQQLADLVNLVRHALIPNFTLVPYRDELRARYETWLVERDAEHAFTPEQREWLDRIAEHIATSLAIEPADFETGWLGQHGSIGKAGALFGDKLGPLMAELNEKLVA